MNSKSFAFFLVIVLVAIAGYLSLKQPDAVNKITPEIKKEIIQRVQSSWSQGINSIDDHLKSDGLTKNDKAELYSLKGAASLQIKDYSTSYEALSKAIILNKELNNYQLAGQNSLDLADYYSSQNQFKNQEKSIRDSIEFFKKSNSQNDLIDARIALADIYQFKRQYDQSITEYLLVIEDSKKLNDLMGEMLAVNNLARVYQKIGKIEEALVFAEKGLEMNQKLGNQSYINSSKVFLNQLYQQQNQLDRALINIQDSIRDKSQKQELNSYLNEIIELNYLLIISQQFDQAELLNQALLSFAETNKHKQALALLTFYKGLTFIYQDDFILGQELIVSAFEQFTEAKLYTKKPLLVAFLSLTNQLVENKTDVVEPAKVVYYSSDLEPREKSISALALAYYYESQNDSAEFNKWLENAEKHLDQSWIWETKMLLEIKHSNQFNESNNADDLAASESKLDELNELLSDKKANKFLDDELFSSILKKLEENSTES